MKNSKPEHSCFVLFMNKKINIVCRILFDFQSLKFQEIEKSFLMFVHHKKNRTIVINVKFKFNEKMNFDSQN